MSWKKRLLKMGPVQNLAVLAAGSFIRLFISPIASCITSMTALKPFMRGDDNAIFAFWHGRMMMCPTVEPPKRKMHVLISSHRDGLLISQVIGHFGEATISGSSSKGGKEAVISCARSRPATISASRPTARAGRCRWRKKASSR